MRSVSLLWGRNLIEREEADKEKDVGGHVLWAIVSDSKSKYDLIIY